MVEQTQQTSQYEVCFVNTEQPPLKIKRLGFFQYAEIEGGVYFSELCEIFYPHPNAPEVAMVSIFRFISVTHIPGSERLLKGAIDAVKDIQSTTTLNITEKTII